MLISMSRLKRAAFALTPIVVLLTAGETAARIKFFLLHKHDWNYITMPFAVQDTQSMDHAFFVAPAAAADPAAATAADQMNFKWLRPCRDREVFSQHYQKPMPYTWDANCFRGDHVAQEKPAGEIRVFVMGGSTVEDAQPDADTWTMQMKGQLANPRVKVVNAGETAMGSATIARLYDEKIRRFAPDVVLYYEAWNEQSQFWQGPMVDRRIGALNNSLHRLLHYRSALYTYLVEKYAFSRTQDLRFWKIDVAQLHASLNHLSQSASRSGARLVFVTQAIRFPRSWKDVDTFDPNAVEALLDRLRSDPGYAYDTEEISSLNQRLAVFRSIELCRRLNVPVIDILEDVEALGGEGRRPLFLDMGHLTWQGDRLVGQLVAKKLAALGVL
jgi:hypothetical protein